MYTCHSAFTRELSKVPTPRMTVEVRMTRRGPQRSASQPTMGPAAPSSRSDSAAAPESEARSHPNVVSIGLM